MHCTGRFIIVGGTKWVFFGSFLTSNKYFLIMSRVAINVLIKRVHGK